MRLNLHRLLLLPLIALGVMSLGSCDDTLSNIGESILPERDLLRSNRYELQFSASTVEAPQVYSGNSTVGLVGAISDPEYGDFSADFVAQMRTAPRFKFTHQPIGGTVDSVKLRLVYTKHIGVTTAPLMLSVYEAPRGFTGSEYSETSLSRYADPSKLLGRRTLTLATAAEKLQLTSDTSQYYHFLTINLERELGQRIYDLTQSAPETFATPEAFSQGALGGFYITASTGSGAVIRVGSVEMYIYYSYKNTAGETKTAREIFINTKLTPHANGLSSTHISALLAASNDYTYVKGPSGVQTELTLSAAQMARLLEGRGAIALGKTFTLADTQLRLKVDNPSNLLLNPPTYMMLMPADSVADFFKRGQTERTQAATSYLSSAYSVDSTHYNFANIARVISTHLREHAQYRNGTWSVAQDLKLRILPVDRSAVTSGSTTTTTAIDEYLFPNFVRLSKSADALRIGVVTSEFVL